MTKHYILHNFSKEIYLNIMFFNTLIYIFHNVRLRTSYEKKMPNRYGFMCLGASPIYFSLCPTCYILKKSFKNKF